MDTNTDMSKIEKIEKPVRAWKMVTDTKTRLVKGIKASQTDEATIKFISQNLPAALTEFTEILFEQAGLDTKIQEIPDFQFLDELDFEGTVNADRIADSHVKEAKLKSLVDHVSKTNQDMIKKMDELIKIGPPPQPGSTTFFNKMEKVKLIGNYFYLT